MDIESIVTRVWEEHKMISGILHKSIGILVGYDENVYIDEKESFLRQIKVFMSNYEKLVIPHYRFEEKNLYPLLINEFGKRAEGLVKDHKLLTSYRAEIRKLIESEDVDKILSKLRILYETAIKHQEKEVDLIKQYLKRKNIHVDL